MWKTQAFATVRLLQSTGLTILILSIAVRIITVGYRPFSVQNVAMAVQTSVYADKTADRLRNRQHVYIRSIADRIVSIINRR